MPNTHQAFFLLHCQQSSCFLPDTRLHHWPQISQQPRSLQNYQFGLEASPLWLCADPSSMLSQTDIKCSRSKEGMGLIGISWAMAAALQEAQLWCWPQLSEWAVWGTFPETWKPILAFFPALSGWPGAFLIFPFHKPGEAMQAVRHTWRRPSISFHHPFIWFIFVTLKVTSCPPVPHWKKSQFGPG